MAYKVEIYFSSYIDVSEYVTGCGEIPFITTNEDRSLITEGVALNITTAYTDNTLAVNQEVKISKDGVLVFRGVIESVKQNWATKEYIIGLKHSIETFQDKLVSLGDLGAMMLKYRSIMSVYYHDFHLISLSDLFDAIFEANGYALDRTYYTDANLGDLYTFEESYNIEVVANVNISDIYFLPNQLYCLNQTGIYTPNEISMDTSKKIKRINQFELLSLLCSITGCNFVPKDGTTFYLVNDTAISTVPNDEKYDYIVEQEVANANSLSLSYNTLKPHPNIYLLPNNGVQIAYYNDGYTQTRYLAQEFQGDTAPVDSISLITNFQPFVLQPFGASNECRPFQMRPIVEGSIIKNKAKSKINDYTETPIVTDDSTIPKTIKRNYISMQNNTSKIIDISYN